MIKTLEDDVENFVASVPGATQNYKRFLERKRNFSGDYLIDKAIDYGIKMLNSGIGKTIPPERAAVIFEEQAAICDTLAEYCRKIIRK